jgi:ABC-2 type transport system ATP-binding protein
MGIGASMHDVNKAFGTREVLCGATLAVPSGTITGLIGANGSGKTTLLRTLLGLIRADAGVVMIGGMVPWVALERYRVAYFAGGATLPRDVRVDSWASLFGVSGGLRLERRRLGVLSRGQRQLIGLRVILASRDLDLVVLDEPWEGLDPDGSRWLSETLRAKRRDGVAILVSSHRLADMVEVCDRFAMLVRGVVHRVDCPDATGPATIDTLRRAYQETART